MSIRQGIPFQDRGERLILASPLSLTRFSGVLARSEGEGKPLKTVCSALGRRNTPLKRVLMRVAHGLEEFCRAPRD